MPGWFPFRADLYYRYTRGMNDAQKGAYMDASVDALTDEREGVTPLADSMLADKEAFTAKKREAGRLGGLARVRNAGESAQPSHASSNAKQCQAPLGNAQAMPSTAQARSSQTNKQTNKQTEQTPHVINSVNSVRGMGVADATPITPSLTPTATSARGSNGTGRKTGTGKTAKKFRWSDIADWYAYINELGAEHLVDFILWFSREESNAAARARYERFIRKHGTREFRKLIEMYGADIKAGEEPDNTGAAFMARLRRYEESKKGAK